MSLDTFNEILIQAFSTRHPNLTVPYHGCIKKGKKVPDYGAWLYEKNALLGVLPKATPWLRDVHKMRVKNDVARHWPF